MDRWKVTALVLGGMVVGMVYGSACSLSASASGTTGTRAVLYLRGNAGQTCPDGFTEVGSGPNYYAGNDPTIACVED